VILLTGGSGQVGSQVKKLLDLNEIPYLSPTSKEFPLDNHLEIIHYLSINYFTTIIHLAAETDVDFCEMNPNLAFERNSKSVAVIADYCVKNSKKVIYLSSSAVLSGGSSFLHPENSAYFPSNVYGASKMRGEIAILESPVEHLIIRASWMLGISTKGPKFAQIIYERISEGASVSAVFDKFGSLTSTKRLAEFIVKNLEFNKSGIVHVASKTPCSRYEIAKFIANYLEKSVVVDSVSNEDFKLPAPRGFSEGLQSENASGYYGYEALSWEDELMTFLKEIC
jgi:dTDP-4-dehydrorhamnose reductase